MKCTNRFVFTKTWWGGGMNNIQNPFWISQNSLRTFREFYLQRFYAATRCFETTFCFQLPTSPLFCAWCCHLQSGCIEGLPYCCDHFESSFSCACFEIHSMFPAVWLSFRLPSLCHPFVVPFMEPFRHFFPGGVWLGLLAILLHGSYTNHLFSLEAFTL